MLLENEAALGQIVVYDPEFNLIMEELPSIYKLVELAKSENYNHKYENLFTGQIVSYGFHVFSTLERIQREIQNIGYVHDEKRKEYLKECRVLIDRYLDKKSA